MDNAPQPVVSSLLRPKLTAPQVASDSLCRPQVLEALAGHPNARLVLFSAPAGSGKTTALVAFAQACQERGSAVAWFSLDDEDDEPARFFAQLIETLNCAAPGIGQDALGYLQNTMSVPVAAVMESLLVNLADIHKPLLLVLDDVHLLQDRELFAAINRLVQLAPAGFTLALGSRAQPPLNLDT